MKEIDTNTKQPLVSVIMPTYNHAQFIGEAIDSVSSQTYKNFELIIIDNYSEDDTEEIVLSYKDDRIKYLKFRNNGVIAASRNYGIRHSQGEYIAFLDSDDKWDKKKLEKQLPHFQSSEIVGVASDAILITDTPYYRKKNYGRSKLGYIDYRYIDILNSNPIMTSSCIVNREILENVGFFDENRDFCFIEDWELWLRMTRYGSVRVLESPLLTYFVSRKRGYQSSIISKNYLKILEKQVNLSLVRYDEIIEPKVSVYLAIARNLLEFDQQQSREYYIKALKTTSNIRRKIKSYVGILVSLLPPSLRTIVLLILYKADRLLFSIRKGSGGLAKSDHYV
jgi:glycosyltransferase involved in cell wall biosynthesis